MRTALLLLLGLLTACQSVPIDTMNKRMAAFEIAYDEALSAIDRQLSEGRIPTDKREQIADAIRKINTARTIAYGALRNGDGELFDDKMRLLSESLLILRQIAADQGASYGHERRIAA